MTLDFAIAYHSAIFTLDCDVELCPFGCSTCIVFIYYLIYNYLYNKYYNIFKYFIYYFEIKKNFLYICIKYMNFSKFHYIYI